MAALSRWVDQLRRKMNEQRIIADQKLIAEEQLLNATIPDNRDKIKDAISIPPAKSVYVRISRV